MGVSAQDMEHAKETYAEMAANDPLLKALTTTTAYAASTWPELDKAYVNQIEGWLKRVSYKPGWRIELRLDQFPITGFLQVSILAKVPDSYHPSDQIEVGSVAVLPSHLCSLEEFAKWLGFILREREIHECREWLQVDGKVFDNPHTVDGWKGGS